jgi:hypothetical protein
MSGRLCWLWLVGAHERAFKMTFELKRARAKRNENSTAFPVLLFSKRPIDKTKIEDERAGGDIIIIIHSQ